MTGPSTLGLQREIAASAFTCPWPYHELYAVPPVQTCGAPFETEGNGAKSASTAAPGHATGSAVPSRIACTRPGAILPYQLFTSAATPATCGDAIDVPCK